MRRSLGRQGPRSPLKSTSRLRGKSFAFSDADIGDEDDNEDEDNEDDEDADEEDEEYVPIMKIDHSEHIFPLSFVPKSRDTENEIQSVVLIPAPFVATSDITNIITKCVRKTNIACQCVKCCTPIISEHQGIMHHERDFLTSKDNFSLFRWADNQKITSPDLLAIHELTEAMKERSTSAAADTTTTGTGAGGYHTHTQRRAAEDDHWAETDTLFDAKDTRIDGLYNDNPPLLANILLDAEQVPVSIAQISAANLQLSRATQRILRDLLGGIRAQQLRKKWIEMNGKSSGKGSQSTSMLKSEKEKEGVKRLDVPGEVHLLQQLGTAPVLQIIENPIAGGNTQPQLPKPHLTCGGQLSQWGSEGTTTDRTGALPRGWTGNRGGQRAKFKLHLHQLLLSDHPLMSFEERQLVQLKAIYTQYRSLFEQKILEFLTQRLLVLTSELATAVSAQYYDKEYTEEEIQALRGTYRDLVETIPALVELNEAVDTLSSRVYEGWREIQELRLRSGVHRTTAELTVRKVKSKLLAPMSARGNSTSHHPSTTTAAAEDHSYLDTDPNNNNTDTGEFWLKLKQNLQSTPQLLKNAQEIIFKSTFEEENDENSYEKPLESARLGSEFGGSQVAMVVNEKQRSKQMELKKVVTIITSCIQKLIDNNGIIPNYVLRLTETGTLTPENQLIPGELKRRSLLKNIKIRAIVKINGKTITSTELYSLKSTTLSVDFNRYFEFRVLHQPMSVTVDLYTTDVSAWSSTEKYLATVTVPFPAQCNQRSSNSRIHSSSTGGSSGGVGEGGQHQHVTHSYTPTTGWVSFTSQQTPSDTSGSSGGDGSSSRIEVSSLFNFIIIFFIDFYD
mgnify:CR=1 FL=1